MVGKEVIDGDVGRERWSLPEVTDGMVQAAMLKFHSYPVRDASEVYEEMMREVILAALNAKTNS